MSKIRLSLSPLLVLSAFAFSVGYMPACGQTASAPAAKLGLNAVLVLTPDFCATKTKTANGTFEVGKAACAELEPALKAVFNRLAVRADSTLQTGEQVALRPTAFDVTFGTSPTSRLESEVTVDLEWTGTVQSGRVVWIDKVEGSAHHRAASAFNVRKVATEMMEDAIKDACSRSANLMSQSAELHKLTP